MYLGIGVGEVYLGVGEAHPISRMAKSIENRGRHVSFIIVLACVALVLLVLSLAIQVCYGAEDCKPLLIRLLF
jgi:hypothetical protein